MRNKKRIAVWVMAALLTAGGVATVKAQTIELATASFDLLETIRPAAEISGSLLVGMQRTGKPGERFGMGIVVPETWAGTEMCLRLISIDGLYEATATVPVAPDWPGQTLIFPFPTRHPAELFERVPGAIALSATRPACGSAPAETTLTYWTDDAGDAALLVNSFQADTVYAYFGDEPVPVRCDPLRLDGRSAYDTRCPLSGVTARGSTTVSLLRVVDGDVAPQVTLQVWLP